jgi:zinc transport system substrate-binding protein
MARSSCIMVIRTIFFSLLLLSASSFSHANSNVLVSIPPLAMLYQQLMPQAHSVDILLHSEQNMHDYALTIQDLKRLHQAPVFIYLGGDNEAFLHKVKAKNNKAQWFALAPDSEHIWLDFNQLPQLIQALASVLQQLYPEQSHAITQNQQRLLADLKHLQNQWQQRFSAHQNQPFLLGHDAFAVFAESLGLTGAMLYLAHHSHGHKQSGAKTLLQLQQRIGKQEIICAIEEPGVSFQALKQRYSYLNTVQLSAYGEANINFIAFLQSNAEKLLHCLQTKDN